MKNKVCYLFVFNGYSDWEPALAADRVITANGTAGTAFAHAIVSKLGLLENEQFAFWFGFFHKPEFQSLWHE